MEAFVARDGALDDEIDNQPAKRSTHESPGAKGKSKELRRDGSFEELDQPTPLSETSASSKFNYKCLCSQIEQRTSRTLQECTRII